MKKLSVFFIFIIFYFACTDKVKYSENLNGTWINSVTSDIYFFKYPDVEFNLAEDYQRIAKRANVKGAKVVEGFKGKYQANENTVYITYYQNMINDTWYDINKNEIGEIPFQYELDNNTLILQNAFGKKLKLIKKKE